ncbi:MAG: FAD-dependent oxidoreductase [Nevskia sp.]|nr:FAD-dependent oxidoreductase [Nevskia sp.]
MSGNGCRRAGLAQLPRRFDLVVIGGGITGAGIAAEAARTGASVLLVEQGDFAGATSSASSKLVHGGLRYLKSGQWRLTLESVRERNRLLRSRPALVQRLRFLMPVYRGARPGLAAMRVALAIYDLMGRSWDSRAVSAAQALALEPGLAAEGLRGAVLYDDAQTDDARLVLCLLQEAQAAGAAALNYVRVEQVLSAGGGVRGVALRDLADGAGGEVEADLVIDAAGVQATSLPGAPAGGPALRPLRGSHLLFSLERLPVRRAVSWLHPRDRRPVFVYPWQGVALYGTTDVDHAGGPVRMSAAEADYLLEGLARQFPRLGLGLDDALASFAGVRPVVAGGKADPSAESRESAIWSAPGWVGATGGKLTTFRVTARQVLAEAARQFPRLAPAPQYAAAAPALQHRGEPFRQWLRQAGDSEREAVAGTPYCWGELRWSARCEAVLHLDDLLLRRTRIGLLLAHGGAGLLERVGMICREEMAWDQPRWQQERARYLVLWRAQHAPHPERDA